MEGHAPLKVNYKKSHSYCHVMTNSFHSHKAPSNSRTQTRRRVAILLVRSVNKLIKNCLQWPSIVHTPNYYKLKTSPTLWEEDAVVAGGSSSSSIIRIIQVVSISCTRTHTIVDGTSWTSSEGRVPLQRVM